MAPNYSHSHLHELAINVAVFSLIAFHMVFRQMFLASSISPSHMTCLPGEGSLRPVTAPIEPWTGFRFASRQAPAPRPPITTPLHSTRMPVGLLGLRYQNAVFYRKVGIFNEQKSLFVRIVIFIENLNLSCSSRVFRYFGVLGHFDSRRNTPLDFDAIFSDWSRPGYLPTGIGNLKYN